MRALAFLLAAAVAAQEPAPAAAPEASTAAAASTPAPGDGVHVAGEDAASKPAPKLSRPIKASIPKDAKDWEPVGLKEGGDPYQLATAVRLKQFKTVKGAVKGERSPAKASVRSYAVKPGEVLLVVAVFPKALEKARKHFEVRLRVVEGNVEKVEAALLTVTDRRAYKELDRVGLRRAGAAFEEENPGSGLVSIAALDLKAGKASWNAGSLTGASFADPAVGFADVSWSSKTVEKP